MTAGLTIESLDSVRRRLGDLPGPDRAAMAAARTREARLTKPEGALGRLEEMTAWLSGWQGRHPPRCESVRAAVFAGNHGLAAHGVSAYPQAVTAQMVETFRSGGAAVNQLCRTFGVALTVHAFDLDKPTADVLQAPAMSEADCAAAMAAGAEVVASAGDLLCLGEMGIGNTTAAAALACALYGGEAAGWTGPGTGVSGTAQIRKTAVVAAAVARHRDAAIDPLDLLRRLGGWEMAAIAGAVLAARLARVPVILDGFVACAAAAPLAALRPDALDHCQVGHLSAEPGHRRLLDWLDKTPLLGLDMRLGEASGAVLAVPLLRAAVACHTGMATFGEAGVAGRSEN